MAGNVEDFVNNVRNLTAQGHFSQLCDYMNKSWQVLFKNMCHLDTALEALDLQEHSLGMLYILYVKVSMLTSSNASAEEFEQLFFQYQLFVTQCISSQVQYSTGNFTQMCHIITQELCKRKMAIRGIRSLCIAISKVQTEPSQLTSLHSDLCQLCLDSKCFKPAFPYITVEISDIAKENGWYECKHFLSYYYYSGMIFAALKQYGRALYCFEQAVSCPATVVSHIMVEAYKKYILVRLIVEGEFLSLPKYTSQVITRFVKLFTVEYNELVQAFYTNDPSKINAVVESHTAVFASDKNLGLIKQVVASMQKRNIQRLTKTFLTLSLSDVAARTFLQGPEEAELHLRQMIEDGEIIAYIDQESHMVSFYDDSEKYNTASMFKEIDKQIQNVTELDRKIANLDQNIQVNPMYVQKVKTISTQDEDFDGGLLSTSSSSTSTSSQPLSMLSSTSSRSFNMLSKLMFK
ncbi:COP9 signalosome complex subunit 3-like [Clavelina lepadiformis]|uniref:COP9 signalosome complex subunit 3 n=1 Tax=Clavelina lepadiformis TaxID=159417 RepID=A0ABP0H274_CLALP